MTCPQLILKEGQLFTGLQVRRCLALLSKMVDISLITGPGIFHLVCLFFFLFLMFVVSGNPTVLAGLLEAGCSPSSPDIHGAYPLHYAAQESREPLPTGEIEGMNLV